MTHIKGTLIRKADGGYEGTLVPSSGLPDDLPPITLHGVSDLTARVDNRSKAVLAAEEFAACRCRVEMLKGQLLAEQDRLLELCRQVNDAMDEEIKEATK